MIRSCIASGLVMLGIGEEGTRILVDPDSVEESNLSRIDYATFDDIDRPKVDVARDYIERARPQGQIITFQQECFDREVLQALASCDLIIGAVDSEAARYALTHLSANFMVPYLDAGAGVIIDKLMGRQIVTPGGQIRLSIPGVSPCLHCTLGLNQSAIENELARRNLTEDDMELLRKTGYLQDLLSTGAPQPSVYNLNQITAGITTSTLLSYVLRSVDYHFASLDLEKLEILKGKSKSNELCPYCGKNNCIGNAELFDFEEYINPPSAEVPELSYRGKDRDGADLEIVSAEDKQDAVC
ncbi:ThiF family adenylyltransferase [Candidatus Poribacteria bacterium]